MYRADGHRVVIPIPRLVERIVRTDILMTAFNRSKLGSRTPRRRVVELACGHRIVTTAAHRARCMRCEEMLRRSVTDGSEDYESFRHGGKIDRMEWADDPHRALNEKMGND